MIYYLVPETSGRGHSAGSKRGRSSRRSQLAVHAKHLNSNGKRDIGASEIKTTRELRQSSLSGALPQDVREHYPMAD